MIPFANLTLDPEPPTRASQSKPNARAQALKRWKRGKIALKVTCEGRSLTPDEIDWSTLPQTSGPRAEGGHTVRVSDRALRRIDALIPSHGGTRTAVIDAVLALALAEKRKKPHR